MSGAPLYLLIQLWNSCWVYNDECALVLFLFFFLLSHVLVYCWMLVLEINHLPVFDSSLCAFHCLFPSPRLFKNDDDSNLIVLYLIENVSYYTLIFSNMANKNNIHRERKMRFSLSLSTGLLTHGKYQNHRCSQSLLLLQTGPRKRGVIVERW